MAAFRWLPSVKHPLPPSVCLPFRRRKETREAARKDFSQPGVFRDRSKRLTNKCLFCLLRSFTGELAHHFNMGNLDSSLLYPSNIENFQISVRFYFLFCLLLSDPPFHRSARLCCEHHSELNIGGFFSFYYKRAYATVP